MKDDILLDSWYAAKESPTHLALMMEQYKRELQNGLLNIGFKLGEGIRTNGKPYNWIIDCREVLLTKPYLLYAGRLLWERLRPYQPEMVGGMAISADPLIIAVLCEAWTEGYLLDGFIIRNEPKTQGLCKYIEGPPIRPNARVIILDDLVNSGYTLQESLKALEQFHPKVVAVGMIIDYQSDGSEWLHRQNLPFEALFTLKDLGVAMKSPSGDTTGRVNWVWEEFKGPKRNSHSRLSWIWESFKSPKRNSYSSLCVAQGTVFVGGYGGFLLALTLDNGSELWRYPIRTETANRSSTPLFHDGKVYFGAFDGYIYCLDFTTGCLLWEVKYGQQISSSPIIDPDSNLLFIGTKHGKGSLIALDSATGELVWKLKVSDSIDSSPWLDISRHQVIVGSDDFNIYAVDMTTGKERWHFSTGGKVKGKPIVDETGICFVGSLDGFLYALIADSGQLHWKKKLSLSLYSSPLIYRDLAIVGSRSGHVVAVQRNSGAIQWVAKTSDCIRGGAVLVKDTYIAIGSLDGYINLLNGDSGDILWRYKTEGSIMADPSVKSTRLVISSSDGKLYAFSIF
jgi:outer membrane protein assembly factor BamB